MLLVHHVLYIVSETRGGSSQTGTFNFTGIETETWSILLEVNLRQNSRTFITLT
jgi:hypothetical protein